MQTTQFMVVIPNTERTAIARIVPIDVPVRIEDGIEILTTEAMDMIEKVQRENMGITRCPLCGKVEEVGQLHAMYRCEGAIEQLSSVLKPPAKA